MAGLGNSYKVGTLKSGLVYDSYLQGMMELRMEQIEENIDEDTVGIYHHPHLPPLYGTAYAKTLTQARTPEMVQSHLLGFPSPCVPSNL